MNRRTSIIALVVLVLGIVVFTYIGVNGFAVGRYDVLPFSKSITQGLDLKGGVYAVYEAQDTTQSDLPTKIKDAMEIMRNRLDAKGYTEATLSTQGVNNTRIRVEIPGVSNPDEIFSLIGEPAKLEFVDPDGLVVMSGERIVKAQAVLQSGAYVVDFTLDAQGTTQFANATIRLVGKALSIKLDGNVISSPTVNTAITGGSGYIEGNFTQPEAEKLALQLQSGALPLTLTQLEARTISATLGVDALRTSVEAGAFGLLAVVIFMMAFYRLPGFLADISLIIYTLIVLYILVFTGIQLTLPGIAGIIISMGMAVDANVIIFERIKDEMVAGKTLRSAVDAGFKKAFNAIIDSNVTTVLAGIVLALLGTGSIKGFAYTLIIGVVVSMFTAITLTRFLMNVMIKLNVTIPWLYSYRWKKEEVVK
jgi:preprotein translocase subunit SecD